MTVCIQQRSERDQVKRSVRNDGDESRMVGQRRSQNAGEQALRQRLPIASLLYGSDVRLYEFVDLIPRRKSMNADAVRRQRQSVRILVRIENIFDQGLARPQ